MALTTLDRLKRRIGQDGTDHDALLNEIITEMSQDIEHRAGRIFNEQSHTAYLNGDGTPRLVLPQGPLVSITTIESIAYSDDGAGARVETETTILESTFLESGVRARGEDGPPVLVRIGSAWPFGKQNIKVVFVGGYDTLPEKLIGDVTTACAGRWFVREAAGLRGKTEGDYSIERSAGAFGPEAQTDDALDRLANPWRYDWGVV